MDIILYHSWSTWVSTVYQNSSLSDSHLTRLTFMSKRAENCHLQSSMAFWHGNPDDNVSFCYTWTSLFYIPSAQCCCLPKLSSKGTLKRMPSYFLLQQKKMERPATHLGWKTMRNQAGSELKTSSVLPCLQHAECWKVLYKVLGKKRHQWSCPDINSTNCSTNLSGKMYPQVQSLHGCFEGNQLLSVWVWDIVGRRKPMPVMVTVSLVNPCLEVIVPMREITTDG